MIRCFMTLVPSAFCTAGCFPYLFWVLEAKKAGIKPSESLLSTLLVRGAGVVAILICHTVRRVIWFGRISRWICYSAQNCINYDKCLCSVWFLYNVNQGSDWPKTSCERTGCSCISDSNTGDSFEITDLRSAEIWTSVWFLKVGNPTDGP